MKLSKKIFRFFTAMLLSGAALSACADSEPNLMEIDLSNITDNVLTITDISNKAGDCSNAVTFDPAIQVGDEISPNQYLDLQASFDESSSIGCDLTISSSDENYYVLHLRPSANGTTSTLDIDLYNLAPFFSQYLDYQSYGNIWHHYSQYFVELSFNII